MLPWRGLGRVAGDSSDVKAALMAAQAVAELVLRLELPSRLRDVDVPREEFEKIASAAASETDGKEEILEILNRAW